MLKQIIIIISILLMFGCTQSTINAGKNNEQIFELCTDLKPGQGKLVRSKTTPTWDILDGASKAYITLSKKDDKCDFYPLAGDSNLISGLKDATGGLSSMGTIPLR